MPSNHKTYEVRLNGKRLFDIQTREKQTTKQLTQLICLLLTNCYTKVFGWGDTSAYGQLLTNKPDLSPTKHHKIHRCAALHHHWQRYIKNRFIVHNTIIFLFDKTSFMQEVFATIQFRKRVKLHDVYILGRASFRNS